MELYGIYNVRGGTFSKPILPEYQIETLLDILHMANDKCLLCGYKVILLKTAHYMTIKSSNVNIVIKILHLMKQNVTYRVYRLFFLNPI